MRPEIAPGPEAKDRARAKVAPITTQAEIRIAGTITMMAAGLGGAAT